MYPLEKSADPFAIVMGAKRGVGDPHRHETFLERARRLSEFLPTVHVDTDEGERVEARFVASTCDYIGKDEDGAYQEVIGKLHYSPEVDAWIASVECSYIPEADGAFYADLIACGQDIIPLLKILQGRVDYFVADNTLCRRTLSTLPLHLTPENVTFALDKAESSACPHA